jgi:hypothetical protein
LDFIHRLVCGRQNTTTFRRLDLSPSSGGWGRINLLSWARQQSLSRFILLHSPEDGDRSGLRNVVVFCLSHTRQWIKSKTSPIALYNIHHRQNPFKSNYLSSSQVICLVDVSVHHTYMEHGRKATLRVIWPVRITGWFSSNTVNSQQNMIAHELHYYDEILHFMEFM